MVFIFAEFALLGKSFFDTSEVALAVRVSGRLYRGEIGEDAVGGDLLAQLAAEKLSAKTIPQLDVATDGEGENGTRLDESVCHFVFGDVHDFIFCDFAFDCKDYFSRSAASCLRSLPK